MVMQPFPQQPLFGPDTPAQELNQPFNPFLRFLEEQPRSAFFSQLPQNLTTGQQQFASSQFQPTLDRFLGGIGRTILGGGTPDQTFTQFLQGQMQNGAPNFDFNRAFRRAPSFQTGLGTSGLTSRARFLF